MCSPACGVANPPIVVVVGEPKTVAWGHDSCAGEYAHIPSLAHTHTHTETHLVDNAHMRYGTPESYNHTLAVGCQQLRICVCLQTMLCTHAAVIPTCCACVEICVCCVYECSSLVCPLSTPHLQTTRGLL